jgi:hypothetical protein
MDYLVLSLHLFHNHICLGPLYVNYQPHLVHFLLTQRTVTKHKWWTSARYIMLSARGISFCGKTVHVFLEGSACRSVSIVTVYSFSCDVL